MRVVHRLWWMQRDEAHDERGGPATARPEADTGADTEADMEADTEAHIEPTPADRLGMDVEGMRHALRHESSPSLERRRRIVALAAAGVIDFTLISLFQTGLVRRLPDPPGAIFDSAAVNSSRHAFAFGHPDGTSGAVMFAGTMLLATIGGTRRTGRHWIWDALTAGAVAAGAAAGASYLVDMVKNQKKVCPYCVTGAGLSFAMLPPALHEASDAIRDR